MTQKELFAKALRAEGSVLVASKRKYDTYSRPGYPGTYYFLGLNGSVRVGPNKTNSLPASLGFKAILLIKARNLIEVEKAVKKKISA